MTDEDAQSRINHIESINNMIFELVYYAHFNFQDCESMTSVELKWFHQKLLKTKDAERTAHENAMKEVAQARNSKVVNFNSHRRSN